MSKNNEDKYNSAAKLATGVEKDLADLRCLVEFAKLFNDERLHYTERMIKKMSQINNRVAQLSKKIDKLAEGTQS